MRSPPRQLLTAELTLHCNAGGIAKEEQFYITIFIFSIKYSMYYQNFLDSWVRGPDKLYLQNAMSQICTY